MNKSVRDRLVGGLGAVGGAAILYALIMYFISEGAQMFWSLTLTVGIVGAVLLSVAIFIHIKYRQASPVQIVNT
jgi:hypothetical protein